MLLMNDRDEWCDTLAAHTSVHTDAIISGKPFLSNSFHACYVWIGKYGWLAPGIVRPGESPISTGARRSDTTEVDGSDWRRETGRSSFRVTRSWLGRMEQRAAGEMAGGVIVRPAPCYTDRANSGGLLSDHS